MNKFVMIVTKDGRVHICTTNKKNGVLKDIGGKNINKCVELEHVIFSSSIDIKE